MQRLDASRAWVFFWTLHSLECMGASVRRDSPLMRYLIASIARLQNEFGGFGGNSHYSSHVLSTYACIHALTILNSPEALDVIDLQKLRNFLGRNHFGEENKTNYQQQIPHWAQLPKSNTNYSYKGLFFAERPFLSECDTRIIYGSLSVLSLCGLLDDEITSGTSALISRCQTHEGGIAGIPGNEAHGGYTYCALASQLILAGLDDFDRQNFIDRNLSLKDGNGYFLGFDLPSLIRWLVKQQGSEEGGFSGRTGKLVDTCYSFWQGAGCAIAGLFEQLVKDTEFIKQLKSNELKENIDQDQQIQKHDFQSITQLKDKNITNQPQFTRFHAMINSKTTKERIESELNQRRKREESGIDADSGSQGGNNYNIWVEQENQIKIDQNLQKKKKNKQNQKHTSLLFSRNESNSLDDIPQNVSHVEGQKQDNKYVDYDSNNSDESDDNSNLSIENSNLLIENSLPETNLEEKDKDKAKDTSSKLGLQKEKQQLAAYRHVKMYRYDQVKSHFDELNQSLNLQQQQLSLNFQLPRIRPIFQPQGLLSYALGCCQDRTGGLKDKPSTHTDLYHTCYSLSGCSIAHVLFSQHLPYLEQQNKTKDIHQHGNIINEGFADHRTCFSSFHESIPPFPSTQDKENIQQKKEILKKSKLLIEEIPDESISIDQRNKQQELDQVNIEQQNFIFENATVDDILAQLDINGLNDENKSNLIKQLQHPPYLSPLINIPLDFNLFSFQPIDAIHNISPEKVRNAKQFFKEKLARLEPNK
ncbi:MAG: putative protein farnesyltransferase subunit beta [Streblomastix strix]|uniref:Prenyltransferase alpha-alpha toroid domain-containing protein n=1 Tax=Streblomastix strix TaxID=222440 RepID=A0A5J4WUX6_9EUKA|nr:MAG: putative protein farnesyltransferase subunit beta [Streblomastix strix]